MVKLCRLFGGVSLLAMLPVMANAAGTYYTGNYQSPQQARYAQKTYANNVATRTGTYASRGVSTYNRNQYANAGYTTGRANQNVTQQVSKNVANNTNRNGFYLNAGMSKQSAMWQFEMNNSGSKLHYDNVDWLVFDVGGKYVFDAGKTKMQIDAGLQYGVQMGETSMVDDDISHGGYKDGVYEMTKENGQAPFKGTVYGRALSVGTSKDGSMFGFNAGLGLTDMWRMGNLKITPSIGWRHLKYKLETSNNYGMVMLNGDFDDSCVTYSDGSTQCAPVIAVVGSGAKTFLPYVFLDADGAPTDDWSKVVYQAFEIHSSAQYAEAEGTFYFHLPDVSHSYDVTWSGPYFALDMQYDINTNNFVTARMELGMPSYTAEGDQPYRYDWAHPKSVEDKGKIGSAFHFGAGANWSTAITDSVSLSLGVTYDYYTVSDADATTYLNGAYWQELYDLYLDDWIAAGKTETNMLDPEKGEPLAIYIDKVRSNGWKDTVDSEIKSFYKSMGVRVGFNARF